MATEGDKDAFIARQEGAVAACDQRGGAMVEIIDNYNRILADARKSGWWPF